MQTGLDEDKRNNQSSNSSATLSGIEEGSEKIRRRNQGPNSKKDADKQDALSEASESVSSRHEPEKKAETVQQDLERTATEKQKKRRMGVPDWIHPARLGYIALFGVIGIFLRYALNILFKNGFKTDSFWSTIIINVVGSGVIAIIQVYGMELHRMNQDLTVGLLTGLMGGFTTYSGYCLDTVLLIDQEKRVRTFLCLIYFLGTPVLALAACFGCLELFRYVIH